MTICTDASKKKPKFIHHVLETSLNGKQRGNESYRPHAGALSPMPAFLALLISVGRAYSPWHCCGIVLPVFFGEILDW